MDDLVTWLNGVLDEIEQAAKAELEQQSWNEYDAEDYNSPQQMLREVEAKRKILELHQPTEKGFGVGPDGTDEEYGVPLCGTCSDSDNAGDLLGDRYPCATVRLLAVPYAGRPGWREEWRPA